MRLLLVVPGALLVLLAFADAVTTTLIAGAGGGPLTRAVSSQLWRGLLQLSRRTGSRRFLTFGGPSVLLATVIVWVALLWAGWALIFAASHGAVVDSHSRMPAGGAERVYFAGFTVFTLGLGDYVPSGAGWQITTVLASFSGLFLVTLSITYLLSVVTAVVAGRRFAASLHLYGDSGAEVILLHAPDGHVSEKLGTRLTALAEEVVAAAQQHLAYPVLHFFHATDERSSIPRALAAADDALLLAGSGLQPECRPAPAVLRPLSNALDFYVATVDSGTVEVDERPPAPELTRLRHVGLPVVSDDEFYEAVEARVETRTSILRLLVSDGRSWPVDDDAWAHV